MGNAAAVTTTNKRYPQRIGAQEVFFGTVAGSASYATGGDTITAASLGLNRIDGGVIQNVNGAKLGEIVPVAGGATALLKIYSAINTEVANASSQTTAVFPAIIWGH